MPPKEGRRQIRIHYLRSGLEGWSESKTSDEAAQYFVGSARSLLRYAAIVTGAVVVFTLLGLLGPLQQMISVPLVTAGEIPLSLWIIFSAALILLTFIYVSRLVQTYLDYRIYPSLGIETGLAYAPNTMLKYLFIVSGSLVALRFVGLDLRVLMVLAGTAGIGIGFGLQKIVGNVTSGLLIILGRQIRKGDWVQVGDTVGMVADIYLRATKVLTRDNIEHFIPNIEFITKTFEIQSRLNFRIFEALHDAGIEIPFPQREIHVRSALDWSTSSGRPDDGNRDVAA